ncbi:hypothetical protein A5697_08545 [Mycobacterium sp. E3251]|nr:hypothetical protein A5697_08545 [Mycobacterium sp. E3251]
MSSQVKLPSLLALGFVTMALAYRGGAALGGALRAAAAGTEGAAGLLDFVSLERHMATNSRITATTATSASRASRGLTQVADIVTSPIAR